MASKPIYEDEFSKLKSEALRLKKYDYLKAMTLMYYCGFRVSETKQFSKNDITSSITSGVLRSYISKQDIYRGIPLGENAKNELAQLLDECKSDYFIFPYKGDGLRVQLNRFIKKVLNTAYSSHGFRRGVIGNLIKKNYDPRSVQEFIAHSDVSTTMKYFDVTWEDVVKMAEAR